MCYQHIMIATDLSDDGKRLVEKSARLAASLQARLSLIYVDIHYDTYHAAIGFSERSYDGVPFEEKIKKELEPLTQNVNYPINEVIIGHGDFIEELKNAVVDKSVDLVVFGHHHDLWNKLFSSTQHAINQLNVDVLVIPIKQ
ncbi:Universal stress protein A [Serratia liquefaciens]|jgi:universal stress protein A|uniref:Universal stress protein n=1 Tax=Serratia liquefaciens TaxID=614 RepID=A0A515CWS0_SERLI|nr:MULTISPECIES: universal stress protein [Serratia]AGQ30676.1 universal stress protein UspA [Serratia liquefaciens ATCC 27592]AMG98086.1 universal stress protein UspA [Serratia liquefaciens]MBF8104700.1 universal stress protein [Serratia liquefaciens]MCS4316687.1 universal stress protein A [Serratia sp. BIGb0234]QDL32583.1 universal stress protein UspA [Serratia liquefaciens]